MTIKEMRKACKMTQKEFCIYFGIPPRTLQAWENNLRTPPVYLVELIGYKLKKEGLLK